MTVSRSSTLTSMDFFNGKVSSNSGQTTSFCWDSISLPPTVSYWWKCKYTKYKKPFIRSMSRKSVINQLTGNLIKATSRPLQLILTSYAIYTSLFAYKTEFLLVFWCWPPAHGYLVSWWWNKLRLAEKVVWYNSQEKIRKVSFNKYRHFVKKRVWHLD